MNQAINVNIIFRDHEGHELGRIAHQNIHETLIPAFKEDSHDIDLTPNLTPIHS